MLDDVRVSKMNNVCMNVYVWRVQHQPGTLFHRYNISSEWIALTKGTDALRNEIYGT
jgi:hypothetical protein